MIFKEDYIAGNVLEYLYNNADKSFGIEYLLSKFGNSMVDINYLKREIEFLVSEELLHKESAGVNTKYNKEVIEYAYRIRHKGYSYIN